MMLCLYFMTVCMILSYGMCNKGTALFLIPMFIGLTFLCVADHCYGKTISKLKDEIRELYKLKDEIRELHKKIDNIK